MPPPDLPQKTAVSIIGGGPVGLTASALLSHHGIANVVIERRQQAQPAPAAHVLRRHSMEVFERLGVADAIRRAAPILPLHYITWCATLGGREVGRLDIRAGTPGRSGAAGAIWTHCPQNLLEPILLEHAASQPQATVVRGATCTAIHQDDAKALARVRLVDGSEQEMEASWVLIADGAGSRTREALGITMAGQGAIGRFFMIHFAADLRPWIEGRPGPLYWIMNPESPGTLIVHDPVRSHVFMMPMLGSENEEETIPARLAAALAVPVEPEILGVAAWSPHVQVAERYREGRAFLIGDAAHRFPPTGGLGLNTGVLDAHELVGRLGRVLNEGADPSLLDGYEASCRPVAEANAQSSFENLVRLGEISRAIGAQPDLASLEKRLANMGPEERAVLAAAIEAQRSHFTSDGLLAEGA